MNKIPISLDFNFERKFQELKKKYPYSIMKIVGTQPKQLDFAGYIKDFCDAQSQADNSIDGTSNSASKDIVALENDICKPTFKLVAFNKIFTKLLEKYGKNIADDWLESEYIGKSYLHDAHSSTFIPYCYAYDLTKLATEGLFFLNNIIDIDSEVSELGYGVIPYNNKPAEHLDTFINHTKEFVSFCCNRQAGAVGLPNLLLWMYYFLRKDVKEQYNGCHYLENNKIGIEDFSNIDYENQNVKYFKQCTQSLIYALNQPYLRNSIQSAFTNVSIFDHYYAHSLFDGVIFPDGSLAYDAIDDIVELQKLFLTVVSDIRNESMFTFPVLTISLLTEVDDEVTETHEDETPATKSVKNVNKKFKDEKFARWASDHNSKWFDSNFYLSETVDALSNCCRLTSSIKDMMNEQGYFNSIGGSSLSVGSIKINTVNLARIAYDVVNDIPFKFKLEQDSSSESTIRNYLNKIESEYIFKLQKQVELNLYCLDVIRDIIIANKEKRHLLPNISDGLIDLKHMYNTIGVIGIYETLITLQNRLNSLKTTLGFEKDELKELDYIKYDDFNNIYYTDNADNFVKHLFNKGIHDVLKDFKNKYKLDYSLNVEQIPGETAAKKLMAKDEILYPNLVVKDLPLYGNQFIPLGIKTTLEERVRVATLFDKYLNGGSICHINFESTLDKESAWKYLCWLANQGLTYSAFTTKINACRHNHAFFSEYCPICHEHYVTQYARIVGFYTAVNVWSSARKSEFKMREWEQK